ncbi:MAG: helix-turn-helix domain-containing protein [Solirubrobacterales bacterium]
MADDRAFRPLHARAGLRPPVLPDESTVYKMIERGEVKAIRIGTKTLRIPSSELERYLEREPAEPDGATALEERVEAFRAKSGTDPDSFVEA